MPTSSAVVRTAWFRVVACSLLLAVASLASNITTASQMAGRSPHVLAARFLVSKLLNSGTAWAGLAVLAGWLASAVGARWTVRCAHAVGAAVLAPELALVAHYGLGRVIGVYGPEIWSSNVIWFVGGVLCAPLGLVGALCRLPGAGGVVARLVVPAGAIAEPFVRRMFTPLPVFPWPERFSSIATGCVLFGLGVAGAAFVLVVGVLGRRRAFGLAA